VTRRYLPTTLPRLAEEWDGTALDATGAIVAVDDGLAWWATQEVGDLISRL
jgi:hypothetical protein